MNLNSKDTMKNFIKITFVSLCLSAVFLVGCGPDEPITPKNDTADPGDTTTVIEEYIEIRGIRVEGSDKIHCYKDTLS